MFFLIQCPVYHQCPCSTEVLAEEKILVLQSYIEAIVYYIVYEAR